MWGKIHITLDTIIYLLFEMKKRDIKDINYLHFLAGFVEGEGSMSVSVSVNDKFKYGVSIQPVFNVTQHKNGMSILNSFKELFEGGSVTAKFGSPDIFVYTLKGYKNIKKSALPF
uniref:LAGLIDADG homing endonuclease n=1 Tax=Porodaedalea chrysoloma TaxID=74615 RepID=UPI0023AB0EFE|nr:LAGLIDADG homing endonuclease [Porodaedalea chrysoloma]WCF76789.1 LAGLIDADG homing endonuclease [Porodaedalea chrysoloma]